MSTFNFGAEILNGLRKRFGVTSDPAPFVPVSEQLVAVIDDLKEYHLMEERNDHDFKIKFFEHKVGDKTFMMEFLEPLPNSHYSQAPFEYPYKLSVKDNANKEIFELSTKNNGTFGIFKDGNWLGEKSDIDAALAMIPMTEISTHAKKQMNTHIKEPGLKLTNLIKEMSKTNLGTKRIEGDYSFERFMTTLDDKIYTLTAYEQQENLDKKGNLGDFLYTLTVKQMGNLTDNILAKISATADGKYFVSDNDGEQSLKEKHLGLLKIISIDKLVGKVKADIQEQLEGPGIKIYEIGKDLGKRKSVSETINGQYATKTFEATIDDKTYVLTNNRLIDTSYAAFKGGGLLGDYLDSLTVKDVNGEELVKITTSGSTNYILSKNGKEIKNPSEKKEALEQLSLNKFIEKYKEEFSPQNTLSIPNTMKKMLAARDTFMPSSDPKNGLSLK